MMMGVGMYLTAVLIYISPVINDSEHLFMSLNVTVSFHWLFLDF